MLSRIAYGVAKRAAINTASSGQRSLYIQRPIVNYFSTEIKPGYGKGKTSTGIVGLPVDPDAVEKIIVKYQALLDKMAASDMPETAQYRMDVEKIARYRIDIAMEHRDDPDMVEDLCRGGQVEELVKQADDEMQVLDMYLSTRMWELVENDDDEDIVVENNPDPAQDHAGLEEDLDEEDAVNK